MSPGTIREFPERVSHPSFLKGFTGRAHVKSAVLQASSVTPSTGDDIQSVTINGSPTGGTFTLTYLGPRGIGGLNVANISNTTAGLAYNASAATVQAALEGLTAVGAGNVLVTGGGGQSAVHTIPAGTATGGTFEVTVTLNGVQYTSAPIAWNASAAAIASAVQASQSPAGAAFPGTVAGGGGPINTTAVTLTYGGAAANTPIAAATINTTQLTGGTIGAPTVTTAGVASGAYQVEFRAALGAQEISNLAISTAGLTGGTNVNGVVSKVAYGSMFDINRRRFLAGVILTKVPTDPTKVRRYTAASGESPATIVGINGRNVDLVTAGPESDVDVPVYYHAAVFDKTKILDYATYATDLGNAAAFKTSTFQ